jgi:hypothetical protein
MAMLAMALLGLFALIVGSMRTQAASAESELAEAAARRRLEELRNIPLDALLTTVGTRSAFAVGDGARRLIPPPGAPGWPDRAGVVELCRESRAPGDLPSVLTELGLDLDLDGDGDTDDGPEGGFDVYPVKLSVVWQTGPGAPPRTYVLRSVLTARREDE